MIGWFKKQVVGQHGASGSSPTSTPAASHTKTLTRGSTRQDAHGDADEHAAENRARIDEIHRVTFTLVKEIQKILKAAREGNAAAVPWPGTSALLSLLTGTPQADAGRAAAAALEGTEDEQQHGTLLADPDACAKLVNDALGPGEAKGVADLCAFLLQPEVMDHPSFIKLCCKAGLASNLAHCLRVMRVIEFEAATAGSDSMGSTSSAAAAAAPLPPDPAQVELATSRVALLLSTLCARGDAALGEQVKPHLPGLLSLAVSAYPQRGLHVQAAAAGVVAALMGGAALTSAMVFLLLHNKIMLELVKELCNLCACPGLLHASGAGGGSAFSSGASARQLPAALRQSSPITPGTPLAPWGSNNGAAAPDDDEEEEAEPPLPELVGADAERAGAWLTALAATVCTVTRASALAPALLADFEAAGGYAVVAHMLLRAGDAARRAELLDQACLLVTSIDLGAHPGAMAVPHGGAAAANARAFCIFRAALVASTPVLSAAAAAAPMSSFVPHLVHGGDWSDIDGGSASAADAAAAAAAAGEDGAAAAEVAVTAAVAQRSVAQRVLRLRARRREEAAVDSSVLTADAFRQQVLEGVLHLYTNHPSSYALLEPQHHVLSLYLCALPYFESAELKGLVLKTLEVVCVMFKDVHPHGALQSAATVFNACLAEALTLLAPPGGGSTAQQFLSPASSPLLRSPADRSAPASPPSSLPPRPASPQSLTLMSPPATPPPRAPQRARAAAEDAPRLAKALIDDAEHVWLMLEKLLEFDRAKYSGMFRSVGLLGRVVEPLLRRALAAAAAQSPEAVAAAAAASMARSPRVATAPAAAAAAAALVTRMMALLCRVMAWVVAHDARACEQLRALRVHHLLYDIVAHHAADAVEAALSVLERAAAAAPGETAADLGFLLELVQGDAARAQRWRQAAALCGLRGLLIGGGAVTKDLFRAACGFEAVLATFSSLDSAFDAAAAAARSSGSGDSGDAAAEEAQCFEVMWAAVSALAAAVGGAGGALAGHPANRAYLACEIGYNSLGCCLLNSGVMRSAAHAPGAVNLLFHLVTERHAEFVKAAPASARRASLSAAEATVRNADAVGLVLALLPALSERLARAALDALAACVRAGGYAELAALCATPLARTVATALARAHLVEHRKAGAAAAAADAANSGGGDGGGARQPALPAESLWPFADPVLYGALARGRGDGSAAEGALSAALQGKLVELLVAVAGHQVAPLDVAPLVRAVTLPLLLQDACVPSAEAAAAAEAAWARLNILTALAVHGADSTPFVRLGGDGMAGLAVMCQAVQSAQVSLHGAATHGRSGSGSGNPLGALTRGGGGSARAANDEAARAAAAADCLHRAMAGAAERAAMRYVHVPGLSDSDAPATGGGGGGGGGAGSAGAWPGPNGYSFACWFRFAPPAEEDLEPGAVDPEGLQPMRAWCDGSSGSGGGGSGSAEGGEAWERGVPRRGSVAFSDSGSAVDDEATVTTMPDTPTTSAATSTAAASPMSRGGGRRRRRCLRLWPRARAHRARARAHGPLHERFRLAGH